MLKNKRQFIVIVLIALTVTFIVATSYYLVSQNIIFKSKAAIDNQCNVVGSSYNLSSSNEIALKNFPINLTSNPDVSGFSPNQDSTVYCIAQNQSGCDVIGRNVANEYNISSPVALNYSAQGVNTDPHCKLPGQPALFTPLPSNAPTPTYVAPIDPVSPVPTSSPTNTPVSQAPTPTSNPTPTYSPSSTTSTPVPVTPTVNSVSGSGSSGITSVSSGRGSTNSNLPNTGIEDGPILPIISAVLMLSAFVLYIITGKKSFEDRLQKRITKK